MRKAAGMLFCIVCILTTCACGGNVRNTKTHEVDSKTYSQADINAAINVIKNEFDRKWRGCTLTEISYSGDVNSSIYQDWADRNDADEVIVLLSSFDVDSSGGDGSLNPDSTYANWMWILVRTADGNWRHVDHGY